jgi:hypothetical protein
MPVVRLMCCGWHYPVPEQRVAVNGRKCSVVREGMSESGFRDAGAFRAEADGAAKSMTDCEGNEHPLGLLEVLFSL